MHACYVSDASVAASRDTRGKRVTAASDDDGGRSSRGEGRTRRTRLIKLKVTLESKANVSGLVREELEPEPARSTCTRVGRGGLP